MIVSGAAPPMVDALRRVRRSMFRRVFCRFCHARSRVPIVFGPFHYCASCERAAPDAPETIDDQRRCTGGRYRTIYRGSRGSASGSASLPAPAKWLGPNHSYSVYQRFNSNQKQRPSCQSSFRTLLGQEICPRTNCSTAGSAAATEGVSSWRHSKESPATETRSARGLVLNMACA